MCSATQASRMSDYAYRLAWARSNREKIRAYQAAYRKKVSVKHCAYGHDKFRTSSGECPECRRVKDKKRREKWRSETPKEVRLDSYRKHYVKHKSSIKAYRERTRREGKYKNYVN